jgi:hypothetical protein
MNNFPRLLCLAVLSAAAYAQTPSHYFVTSDPSLAGEFQPKAAKPSAATRSSAEIHSTTPATAIAAPADLQIRTPAGRSILPTATVLRLKLNRAISTTSARRGQQFEATLARPVEVDGRLVIPAGSSVNCRVDSAHGPRRIAGKPSISIKARSVRLPNGDELYFSAYLVDTGDPHHLDVDQEGRVRGANSNRVNNIELGAFSGTGAIAGAVIAGPTGLVIGTASGALIATGHILIKHRELTLPAGTELIFELDAPATSERPQLGGIQ